MEKGNLRTNQTLLGLMDLRMTMRYSHLIPGHLKKAVTTLEKRLNSISKGYSMDIEKKEGVNQNG
jgi:hypothetical protein